MKIKYALNFDCIRHKWCQINQKVNILVQSTHSFARVQIEYFLSQRKSSLLVFHFKSKYCLVVQHRRHGTETKGNTGIRATRHCSTLYSVRKMPCFVLFFSSILLFSLFFSGLNIAYQIIPYIKRNLEYISIQAFHFLSYRIPQTFQYEKQTNILMQDNITYFFRDEF